MASGLYIKDDKNTTKKGNGTEGLQVFKKIALALLKIEQAAYPKRTSLKMIRYRMSLDYENEIKQIFTVLDIESIRKAHFQVDIKLHIHSWDFSGLLLVYPSSWKN